jgi:hypothetical protein
MLDQKHASQGQAMHNAGHGLRHEDMSAGDV